MGPLHLKHLRFGASSGVRVGHAWLVDGEHAFVGVGEHAHAEVGGGGGVFGL